MWILRRLRESLGSSCAASGRTWAAGKFETDVWYAIRLVRKGERIETWIDGEKVIDVDTTGKALALRPSPISDCAPFGLATWQTNALIRNVRWRSLD